MNSEIVFQRIEQSTNLPVLSTEMKEILYMLQYPADLDVDSLVSKISKQEELNIIIIKCLNTGYFQLDRKITSIKDAIMLLGLKTIQNLLIFFVSRMLFPEQDSKRHRFDMYSYWKHVLGTSVAAHLLSVRLNIGDKYKLFTYGLVHDIGIPVMDACMPDELDLVGKKIEEGVHQLVAEKTVFSISHAEIGAWLCRRWNIREDIVNIVEYHHTPFFATKHTQEVLLMHIADVISSEYCAKLMGGNIYRRISDRIMNKLGITEEDYRYVYRKLPLEIEKINYFLTL